MGGFAVSLLDLPFWWALVFAYLFGWLCGLVLVAIFEIPRRLIRRAFPDDD